MSRGQDDPGSGRRTITIGTDGGTANHVNVDNISCFAVTDEEPTGLTVKIALIAPLVVLVVISFTVENSGNVLGFLVLLGVLTWMSWAAAHSLNKERLEIATLSTTYASALSEVSGGDTGSKEVLDIEEDFLDAVPENITIENEGATPFLRAYHRLHFVPDNIVSIREGEECPGFCKVFMGVALLFGLGALLALISVQLVEFVVLVVLTIGAFFLGSMYSKTGVEISLHGDETEFFHMAERDASRLVQMFSTREGSGGTVHGQQTN